MFRAQSTVSCAVILVGGLGSRLHPLSYDLPKPLMPLANSPMVNYLLARLGGVERVILACGYGFQAFREWREQNADHFPFAIELFQEHEPRGTGGALAAVRDRLHGNVLLINGDTLLDLDLTAIADRHGRDDAFATMAVTRVEDVSAFGSVTLREQHLQGFQEKQNRSGPGWINAGVYLLSPEAWKSLPEAYPLSLEQQIFPHWLEQGKDFRVWQNRGHFLDVGNPEAYLHSQEIALSGQLGGNPRERLGSEPSAGVSLQGRVVLATDTHIGAGSQLRNCVLWEGASVGENCRLTDCILGRGVRLAAGTELHRCAQVVRSDLAGRNLEPSERVRFF